LLIPTPTAGDSKSPNLGTVAHWPTPTARLGAQRGPQAKRYHDPARSNDLDDAVAASIQNPDLFPKTIDGLWSTPAADDTGHRKAKYAQGGTALSAQAGGSLNPTWVEWLMGYPLGWTDLGASGTVSSPRSPNGSDGRSSGGRHSDDG